jgi:hypothetical protein
MSPQWFKHLELSTIYCAVRGANRIWSIGVVVFFLALPIRGIGGFTGLAAEGQLVALEIRYELAEAGEVFLIWGIGGWQLAPEEQRPEGTIVENGVMRTPMAREGGTFVAQLNLPAWTSVSYGFLATKAADGAALDAYETDGGHDFQTVVSQLDAVVQIQSKLVLPADRPAAESPDAQPILQEIRYRMPEAGEVTLVWGINGWGPVPEEMRPAGTVLEDSVMKTPMTRTGEEFAVTLEVPSGATIDFGFLITRDRDGAAVDAWEADGPDDFHVTASGELIEVQSRLPASQIRGILLDAPLTAQEIRYRMPEASEVWFVWGINGWNVAPEELRPAGTVIADAVMRTPMSRGGDLFTLSIAVPVGTTIDFGFLTTRDQRGGEVALWEANGAEDFHTVATEGGEIEVESRLAPRATARTSPALLIGLVVAVGFALVIAVAWIFNRK